MHSFTFLMLFIWPFHHGHKPRPSAPAIVQDSPEMLDAKAYVMRIDDQFIPIYEKDEKYARMEQVEIATVKADSAVAHIAKTDKAFLSAVDKLTTDVNKLEVLDAVLHVEYLI